MGYCRHRVAITSARTSPLLRTLGPLALALALVSAPCAAVPLAAQSLTVGDVAPDFTVTTVSASGVERTPFTLSAHRGEVVVLAFFPQAGTPGCTTQMESYRDRYAALFNGGNKVTLVGVSTDDSGDLSQWSRKKQFPFRFATDGNKAVGKAYGASGMLWHKRHLYVIDPAGRIAYIARPFKQMSEDAYTELGAAIQAAAAARP
jgi:peroxiredoxin Q/BCP